MNFISNILNIERNGMIISLCLDVKPFYSTMCNDYFSISKYI